MTRLKNDGKGRIGGRKKGTPNKVTTDLKQWIKDLLLNNTGRFEESLDALPPDQYVHVYLRLVNYVIPKLQPVAEEHEQEGQSITVTFATAAEAQRVQEIYDAGLKV